MQPNAYDLCLCNGNVGPEPCLFEDPVYVWSKADNVTYRTDIHATPTNNITSYSNLMRLWTPGNTFPPFPTACIGSVSHQIDEAEIWEQAFRSACSCGGWTATTVTAFMPDPTLTEPVVSNYLDFVFLHELIRMRSRWLPENFLPP